MSGKTVGSSLVRLVLVAGLLLNGLAGCQTIKLGGNPKPATTGTQSTTAASIDLAGPWQISYEVSGEPKSAHVTFNQTGNTFQGTGNDDHDSQSFVIDGGVIQGTKVSFNKRYHYDENPNLPPLVYVGNFEMANTESYKGPYMSGTYSLTKGGQSIGGAWDAQKPGGDGGQAPAQQETPPPPQQGSAGRQPHLSGKWDAGYEFEFKTVHSYIYLEQDNGKITGHGIDKNSKETFSVVGTYKYPNVKLIVKYNAVKGPKGKNKPERKLEFRGTAAAVNDAEYQGVRLEGKTNGGGAWMAELVK